MPSNLTEQEALPARGLGAAEWGIVITVPHATCPSVLEFAELAKRPNTPTGHYCDTSAPFAASLLFQALEQVVGDTVDLAVFPSHVPRYALFPRQECDMNRKRCRYAAYRNEVRAWVENRTRLFGVDRLWDIDVHSFTPGLNAYGPHDCEVVLLDPHRDPNVHEWFTDALAHFLRHQGGVDACVLKGKGNDITDEMHERHFAGEFLLEFNEGLSRVRTGQIAQSIAMWFATRAHKHRLRPSPSMRVVARQAMLNYQPPIRHLQRVQKPASKGAHGKVYRRPRHLRQTTRRAPTC